MVEPTSQTVDRGAVRPESEVIAEDAAGSAEVDAGLVEAELLVEEVSIDGMCGVY